MSKPHTDGNGAVETEHDLWDLSEALDEADDVQQQQYKDQAPDSEDDAKRSSELNVFTLFSVENEDTDSTDGE